VKRCRNEQGKKIRKLPLGSLRVLTVRIFSYKMEQSDVLSVVPNKRFECIRLVVIGNTGQVTAIIRKRRNMFSTISGSVTGFNGINISVLKVGKP
jgi:hypothetical protein